MNLQASLSNGMPARSDASVASQVSVTCDFPDREPVFLGDQPVSGKSAALSSHSRELSS